MNKAVTFMAYAILINLSLGIMSIAIPQFEDDPSVRDGLTYNSSYGNFFITEMESANNLASQMEDEGNLIYRVLDLMSLGFIKRFVNTIQQYLYGIIYLFDKLFGSQLAPEMYTLLFNNGFGLLYGIMTIIYIVTVFYLWTGRKVNN